MNPDSKMCQKCQNIYKTNGRYYKKVMKGHNGFDGLFLWQPMIKILWFYIPNKRRRRFWLDDWGFEGVR